MTDTLFSSIFIAIPDNFHHRANSTTSKIISVVQTKPTIHKLVPIRLHFLTVPCWRRIIETSSEDDDTKDREERGRRRKLRVGNVTHSQNENQNSSWCSAVADRNRNFARTRRKRPPTLLKLTSPRSEEFDEHCLSSSFSVPIVWGEFQTLRHGGEAE